MVVHRMATPDHTPRGRGYHSGMNYFHHANDCTTASRRLPVQWLHSW